MSRPTRIAGVTTSAVGTSTTIDPAVNQGRRSRSRPSGPTIALVPTWR
ncbi:hypothetical protein ACFSM7_00450 [Clavibacter michiganensis subsp. tessellarius]